MQSPDSKRIILDLNAPDFLDQFLELEPADLKKVIKTFKKLRKLTWAEAYKDPGLKLEEIKSHKGLYTLRADQSSRLVVLRTQERMTFVVYQREHDAAYGKK